MKNYERRTAQTPAGKVYGVNRVIVIVASVVVLALALLGGWLYVERADSGGEITDSDTLEGQKSAGAPSIMAQQMQRQGLVDVQRLDSTLQVHLFYATTDNFTGKVLYADLHEAYLQPDVAVKLVEAQRRLKALHPDLSLIVYDAARPIAVQKRMWKLVEGTDNQQYVANPNTGGGLHNYGAAVDLSIVDSTGTALDMGTHYDYFGAEAHIDREDEMLAAGTINREQLDNRLLLRRVMTEAGFQPLENEWWHFNSIPLREARRLYSQVE